MPRTRRSATRQYNWVHGFCGIDARAGASAPIAEPGPGAPTQQQQSPRQQPQDPWEAAHQRQAKRDAYDDEYGIAKPATPWAKKLPDMVFPDEDLQRQEHRTIHFSTMLGARPIGWEYPDGDSYATLQLPGALHVNSAQTYEAAALAGLGLIQAPLLGIGRYLESGALVEIIPDFRRRALAVSLVVAHRRNLSRRVRAFMKWIENVLAPYLE